MSIVESIVSSTNRTPIRVSDNKKSRVLRYIPAAGRNDDGSWNCADDRAELLSAFAVLTATGIYGKGGKDPVTFGSSDALCGIPAMFRPAVRDAMSVVIGTFSALSDASCTTVPAALRRETFAVNGCNLSAKVACAVFCGEPTALTGAQIRRALGVDAARAGA